MTGRESMLHELMLNVVGGLGGGAAPLPPNTN